MFKANTNFKPVEIRRQTIKDYSKGAYFNGIDEALPTNSVRVLQNYDLTDTGSPIARKKTLSLPYLFPADSNATKPIIALGTTKNDVIAVRGDGIYAVDRAVGGIFAKHVTITDLGTAPTGYHDVKEVNVSTFSSTTFLTATTNAASSERYVTTATALNPNELIGKYLHVGSEKRYVTGNTANTIYVYGTFDSSYTSGSTFYVREKEEAWTYHGQSTTRCYKGHSGTPFSSVAVENVGDLEFHKDRYFYSKWTDVSTIKKTDTLYFSEIGIFNHAPKLNFIEVRGKILRIKSFTDRLVIYTTEDVVNLFGDSPDNFYLDYLKTSKLLAKPESIGLGNNIMFYLGSDGIEIQNQVDSKSPNETLGISYEVRDYLNEYLQGSDNFVGEVWDNKYFMCVGSKTLVYDIDKTNKLGAKIYYLYDFSDVPNPLATRVNAPTVIKRSGSDLWLSINGYLLKMVSSGTGKRYVDNYSETSVSLTVESNKISFGDNLRDKIWRRLDVDFGKTTDGVTYTHTVSIAVDDGAYSVVKTTSENSFKCFFTKVGKKMKYKIDSVPSTGTSCTQPLELLQVDAGYEPQYKF